MPITAVVSVLLLIVLVAPLTAGQSRSSSWVGGHHATYGSKQQVSHGVRPTSSWRQYADPRFGYTLRYPSNWFIVSDGRRILLTRLAYNRGQDVPVIVVAALPPDEFENESTRYKAEAAGSHVVELSSGWRILMLASPYLPSQPGAEEARQEARRVLAQIVSTLVLQTAND
jgi:hypothetical protein